MTSFEPVRSIQRGLAILRFISENGACTVTDIAAACKLPQPTVVRIVETLVACGYVYREGGKAAYKITGSTLALSKGFDPYHRLVQLSVPIIDELHMKVGWPSNLAVFDRDSMVIIHSNRGLLGLSIPGRFGARIPMLATGVGLVVLANMSPEERKATLQRIRSSGNRWDNDPRLLGAFEEKLRATVSDGYGIADEEYLEEVYRSRIWAVAVRVEEPNGMHVALSSLVMRAAGEPKRMLSGILPHLRHAAAEISDRLRAEYTHIPG